MSNPSPANNSIVGQQSKRLACDRCRAQKLKCVRPDLSRMCHRCTTARTHCSFGTPRPPGRPPTVRRLTGEPVDNRMPTAATFRQSEFTPSNLPSDIQSNRSDDQNARRQTLPTTRNLMDVGSPVRARYQINNFDDEDLFDMLHDPGMVDFDTSTFGGSPVASTEALGSSWQQPPRQPSDAGGHPQFLPHANISETSVGPRSPQRADLTTHMTLNNTNTQINVASANTPQGRGQNATPIDSGQRMLFSELENLSASRLIGPTTPSFKPPSGNSAAARNQRMQQLMQLGTLMYELQNIHSQDEHAIRPISSDTFPTEFAGKVLQAAIAFLKSLRSFFSDDSSSASGSTSSMCRRGPPDLTDSGDGNFPPSFSPYRPSSNTTSRTSSVYASSSSTESSARRIYAADKPAILQLIACYLRLLQLYLLLYTTIYEYIRSTESDFRRRQPIWSDLSLGSAPLYPFADFQIKLVLQVAVHLLEETEAALGLSERCRVSKKSVAEGSGILGVNVTTHFVEMCMSELTTGAEEGRGAITRLRDIMGRLTGLLDGPVGF